MAVKSDDEHKPTEEILTNYLTSEDRPFTEGRYYASSSFQCPAKHYFARKGHPSDFPIGIGERGRRVEDYVIAALREEYGQDNIYEQIKVEAEIYPGVTISGKVDGLLMGYNLEPTKIWEVKSMNGSPRDLKKGYEFQALFYDKVLQPTEGTEVIVVNTFDFNDTKSFPVKWTDDKMIDYTDYWVKVHEQFNTDKPVQEPGGAWECSYYSKMARKTVTCSFYEVCKGFGDGPRFPKRDDK